MTESFKTAIHKQQGGVLYAVTKMGVAIAGTRVLKHSKEELAWAADKRLWVISNMQPDAGKTYTAHTPDFAHLDIHKTTGNGIQT